MSIRDGGVEMTTGYVGTYTQKNSEGIYQFLFDEKTGMFVESKLFAKIKSSKYIVYYKGEIFSVFEENGNAGVCVFSEDGTCIASVIFEKRTSCFITVEGNYIYTANYHEGTISKLRWSNYKLEWVKSVKIKEFAGCHQVLLWKKRLIVPCLKLDKIMLFDEDLKKKGEICLKVKTGPRHGVISMDGRKLYVVGELSNELIVFSLEEENWKETGRVSLLPPEQNIIEGSAAIRISNDGTYLMISTRFINIITLVDISDEVPVVKQIVPTCGDHPRDILNIAGDQYILVANRMDDCLVALNIKDSLIGSEVSAITVPEGVCICVKGET